MEAYLNDIIPGLPGEIALECLVRVPSARLHRLREVSKSWNWALRASYFGRLLRQQLRYNGDKLRGQKGEFLVILYENRREEQEENPADDDDDDRGYRLIAYDLIKRKWSACVSLPGTGAGTQFPSSAVIILIREKLVVLGYPHPHPNPYTGSEEEEQQRVLVYDFLEMKWREGMPMPGPTRHTFFCGTDGIGTIFVAGGHHNFGLQNQRLYTTVAYDVESDEWIRLPVIWPSPSSTYVPFHGHKLHLVRIGRALQFMITIVWTVEGENVMYKYDPQRYWPYPPHFSPSDWKEIIRFMEQQFGSTTTTTTATNPYHNNLNILPLEYPTCIRGYCCVPFLSEKIIVWD